MEADKTETREEFAKRFAKAITPSEFNDYKAYLQSLLGT